MTTPESAQSRETQVLLNSHHALTMQMAELAQGQQAFEKRVPILIESAVQRILQEPVLSDEERRWVRAAIQAQGKRAARTEAIIEKTFTGLVWVGLLWLGAVILEWLKNLLKS